MQDIYDANENLECKKRMHSIRQQKRCFSRQNYLNLKMLNEEDQDVTRRLLMKIKNCFLAIEKNEKRTSELILSKTLKIGRNALRIKRIISKADTKRKFSRQKLLKQILGSDMRRINEAICVFRAHRKLSKKGIQLPISKLLFLGEMQKSKRKHNRTLAKKILNKGKHREKIENQTHKELKNWFQSKVSINMSENFIPEEALIGFHSELVNLKKNAQSFLMALNNSSTKINCKEDIFKRSKRLSDLLDELAVILKSDFLNAIKKNIKQNTESN